MSDSWIAWKPRIDEPSNISPSVKKSASTDCGGDVEVLHDARQVAEPDVDELDVLVLDVPQDLVGVAEHPSSSSPGGRLPSAPTDARGRGFPCRDPHVSVVLRLRRSLPPRPRYAARRGGEARRRDLAGGPGRAAAGSLGSTPGRGWGLPEHGPGSVAGFGRRVVAYLIDSLACALIAYGLLRDQQLTLPIFAVEVAGADLARRRLGRPARRTACGWSGSTTGRSACRARPCAPCCSAC